MMASSLDILDIFSPLGLKPMPSLSWDKMEIPQLQPNNRLPEYDTIPDISQFEMFKTKFNGMFEYEDEEEEIEDDNPDGWCCHECGQEY